MDRPRTPTSLYAFLVIGIAAASQSGNLVRIGDAPPVAMAAWRLLLATLIMAVLAGRHLRELLALTRRELAFLALAGAALALHLMTWIAAVQHTTVANAAIFFSVNPVMTAAGAHFFLGEKLSARLFVSMGLGMAGVGVMSAGDLVLSRASLLGDGYSVLCAGFFTVYFLCGKRLRSRLDNRAYVAGIYGCAALVSFIGTLLLGHPVVAYSSRTWLCFALLAIVPTAIGHTALNAALRYLDASRVSTATLTEPLLAGIVAYLAWGETVHAAAASGYLLIGLSVVVLVSETKRGNQT